MSALGAACDERPGRTAARSAVLALSLAVAALAPATASIARTPDSCADGRGAVRWTARVEPGGSGLLGRFRVYGGVGEPAIFLFELPAASGEAVYCYPLTGFLAVADRFEIRFVTSSGGEQVLGSVSRNGAGVRTAPAELQLGREFQVLLPSSDPALATHVSISGGPANRLRSSGLRLEPPKPPPW